MFYTGHHSLISYKNELMLSASEAENLDLKTNTIFLPKSSKTKHFTFFNHPEQHSSGISSHLASFEMHPIVCDNLTELELLADHLADCLLVPLHQFCHFCWVSFALRQVSLCVFLAVCEPLFGLLDWNPGKLLMTTPGFCCTTGCQLLVYQECSWEWKNGEGWLTCDSVIQVSQRVSVL